jgi:hypothetical protein
LFCKKKDTNRHKNNKIFTGRKIKRQLPILKEKKKEKPICLTLKKKKKKKNQLPVPCCTLR